MIIAVEEIRAKKTNDKYRSFRLLISILGNFTIIIKRMTDSDKITPHKKVGNKYWQN